MLSSQQEKKQFKWLGAIEESLMFIAQHVEQPLTLEQAKFKQRLGLNEWDPLPEGVEYPEE